MVSNNGEIIMKKINVFALIACAGGCVCAANAQTGVVNVSGATLLENYVKSNASTNDYIDVDRNGVAGWLRNGIQQLAPSGPSNLTQPLAVQYRVTGSVNGFVELTSFGAGRGITNNATDGTDAGLLRGARPSAGITNGNSTTSYFNRTTFITTPTGQPTAGTGTYNLANPGGSPVTQSAGTYTSLYAAPGTSSGGIYTSDVAPMDVSAFLAVQKAGGTPVWRALPNDPGYGRSNVVSPSRPFGAAGVGGESGNLPTLNGRNLDDGNPANANSNTIYSNKLAFAPIGPLVNYGTGITRVTMTDLQHIFVTGRAHTGENFVAVTRDPGSGTRNAFSNCIRVDPSWANGDNIGRFSTSGTESSLGNEYLPTNKGSSGVMETTVQNSRLGIGYIGTERGVTGSGNASWLSRNAMELADVQNDFYGGTQYVRPTTNNIVHNGPNNWVLGGQSVLATIGDPRSNAATAGGLGWGGAFDPFVDSNCNGQYDAGEPYTDLNGNGRYDGVNAEAGIAPSGTPAMANPFAAAYVNNITRSIASTTSVPSDPANLGMPGEYAANQFILIAALDNLHVENSYTTLIPNTGKNLCVQNYTLTANVHNNAKYLAFNNAPAGPVPSRKTGAGNTYSDGVTNGGNYIRQGTTGAFDVAVSYGTALNLRNKIAGDFNGSGARDAGDVTEMLKAYAQRYSSGNPRWTAPDGIYGAGAGQQAIIEVLGDFDGNGSFDRTDVRYYADGLFLVNGNLDRKAGFTAVDNAWAAGNFFGTTLATGKVYAAGDSRGDVAGSAIGTRPGYSPTGANGVINAADIDYVYAQFRNSHILGSADWSDLNEAAYFDLSADINGDLLVDSNDVCELVTVILGTTFGDVNLDGVADSNDLLIASSNLGRAGGWAMGDVDGDGMITADDIAIIISGTCPVISTCPPCAADYNQDGGVDGGDIAAFFPDWEASASCADVNQDGGVDGGDIEAFFAVWENGGC
jgi:hypothetical protein